MYECSKGTFAQIIGRSRALVDLLCKMGVLKCDYFGGVIMYPSFRTYFLDYLYHLGKLGRNLEVQAAIERISKLKIKKSRRTQGLKKARCLLPLIYNVEFKLEILKMLKRLGVNFSASVIKTAEKELENLREEFNAAKVELREKILSAQIKPVQIETILLARYVDCESWAEIEEGYSYSLSHIYRLHRQGLKMFTSAFHEVKR